MHALYHAFGCAGIPPAEGSDEAELLTMSTLNEEGVMNVKQVACDRLLSSRVETKLQVGITDIPLLLWGHTNLQWQDCLLVAIVMHTKALQGCQQMQPLVVCSLHRPRLVWHTSQR